MAIGNSLEDFIRKYKHPKLILHRIKDAQAFGKIRHKTLCDCFGAVDGHPLLIECKETSDTRFHLSKLYRDASKHQLIALKEWANQDPRNIAGYLLLFKGLGLLSFLDVRLFDMEQGSIVPNSHNVKTLIIDDKCDLTRILL